MRNTAAIRAGAHSSVDNVELLGEWKSGSTCANSYLSKSQSSALLAHLSLAGFKWRFDHYLGRAEVQVPDAWVDKVMSGVRKALKVLLEQQERLKCHEKEIGAETLPGHGVLAKPTSETPQVLGTLYTGSPERHQRYHVDCRVQSVC